MFWQRLSIQQVRISAHCIDYIILKQFHKVLQYRTDNTLCELSVFDQFGLSVIMLYLVSILLNYFYFNFLSKSILLNYFHWNFLSEIYFNDHSAKRCYTLITTIVLCTLRQSEGEGHFKGERKRAIWRWIWRGCGKKRMKDCRTQYLLLQLATTGLISSLKIGI